jgi:hypothetical protein
VTATGGDVRRLAYLLPYVASVVVLSARGSNRPRVASQPPRGVWPRHWAPSNSRPEQMLLGSKLDQGNSFLVGYMRTVNEWTILLHVSIWLSTPSR